MKRGILVALCLAGVMGITAWSGAEILRGEDPDALEIIKSRARVMEVASDCSWVIVGEKRFIVGAGIVGDKRYETECLDVDGAPLENACDFRPRDRVYVKGVVLEDRTTLALTIKKRAP